MIASQRLSAITHLKQVMGHCWPRYVPAARDQEMCGYLEWDLNIHDVELEGLTEKVQLKFELGVVNQQLPIPSKSSIAPSVRNH
jgi:hypothetical protein